MDGIGRYAGIDWAKDAHAVCIIDERGQVLIPLRGRAHGRRPAGARVPAHRVEGVAIERPDGPVVEALLEADLPVVVIASRHVKALRTPHGLAGNKDDRADAYILADALRTDGQRLRPLRPDAPATLALRASVQRARKDLVGHRTALAQQLAAHLALAFPGAVDLFDDLASPIARAFLTRIPSPERAASLGPNRMRAWLAAQGYSGRRTGAELHARLVGRPARGRPGECRDARGGDPRPRGCRGRHRRAGQGARGAHRRAAGAAPDAVIFTSLPRAGRVRAAALLAENRGPPRALLHARVARRPGSSWLREGPNLRRRDDDPHLGPFTPLVAPQVRFAGPGRPRCVAMACDASSECF